MLGNRLERAQLPSAYDRYQLKINDKAAALVREAADAVLFVRFETELVRATKSPSDRVDDTFGNRNPSGHAKRDRTAQKKLCDPVSAASISIFQKANLKPKLVPTKSFTPELKLCWPPLTQL